jgi:3-mercaptopyruvate sulfurtransferase SseA
MVTLLLAGMLAMPGTAARGAPAAKEVWQPSDLMEPQELAAILNASDREKPILASVGFDFLYRAAHIPGSVNLGPGSKASGVEHLKQWASGIDKNTAVILYCGCCPWRQCPNVRPAFQAVRQAGLKRVKVLYLRDSLVRDWIDKGYPVEKGK